MLVAVACLLAGGCQKADPRTEPVKAASPSAFGRWRSMASDQIKGEEWREFDAMLQEIRLRVTAERQASGSEAVEAAMQSRIDGATFLEVLAMGYEGKLRRIEPEREEIKRAMNVNAQRAVVERNAEVRADSARMRERQEKRMLQLDTEIAEARRRLEELKKVSAAKKAP